MIKRVFETTLDGGESPMYYCTVCNRPYKALHEANEHAKFCGKAVPTQPVFRSYTTAATFEDTEFDGRIGDDDDDTQVYKKPWVGLTDDDIAQAMCRADAIFTGPMQFKFAKELEAKLRSKNDH